MYMYTCIHTHTLTLSLSLSLSLTHTHTVADSTVLDLMLLSTCDYFIGGFSSHFSRLVLELSVAHKVLFQTKLLFLN
jgi:hypothetical protein